MFSENFGKIDIFGLQNPQRPSEDRLGENSHFMENMKNRSKNRVFHIFKLKIGVFDLFPAYICDSAGKKSISLKTKKLERFFKKCAPPQRKKNRARGGAGGEFF